MSLLWLPEGHLEVITLAAELETTSEDIINVLTHGQYVIMELSQDR
jgi:hypothetical protein